MDNLYNKNFKIVSSSELLGQLNDVEKKFAPEKLFISGNPKILQDNVCVSVIGTRAPSAKGVEAAQKIVEFLVKNNVVVVSGLAKGIDTVAHETAIKNSGKTIAVIGTPLDKYYPKENRKLQDKIGNEHLLISQFEIGSHIYPSNFPMRNRTMALISHVSIIVEAGKHSGTMHQGWEALRLGRQLFILEDVVANKELAWPHKLIEYGAKVLYLDNLEEILDFLPEQTRGKIQHVIEI